MSKFTPGPWERGGTDIRDGDGQLICDASICCPRFEMGAVIANAEVMAAAPEMYDLLRTALLAFDFAAAQGGKELEPYTKTAMRVRQLLKRIEG